MIFVLIPLVLLGLLLVGSFLLQALELSRLGERGHRLDEVFEEKDARLREVDQSAGGLAILVDYKVGAVRMDEKAVIEIECD